MPLRLAPSSPERMAALITELWSYVGSGLCRGNGLSIELAHERCVRLLLRWYAWGQVQLGNWCCWECYRDHWLQQYGRECIGAEETEQDWGWPRAGDERLRKELGE